jgi:small subunit ribosomal protein S1
MSNDVATKKRISLKKEEVKVQEVKITNANPPLEGFDWDAYASDCPSKSRKVNERINAPTGWRIFSKEPYAGELLDLMLEHENKKPSQFKINVGSTYSGVVHKVSEQWSLIDINYREFIYIDMSKEDAGIKEQMTPGGMVDVQIVEDGTTNRRGFILGSVTAGIKTANFHEIMKSIEGGSTAYVGKVGQTIPGGGYIVEVQGVECFMPGSLAGINKLPDFESIVGTELYVVPVSFSDRKGTIVVSHREYLKALIPGKISDLRENSEGQMAGEVTGTTKFGVFVEFDQCLTGMIHINDLTPEYVTKHKSREIAPGDDITFYVKEIINDNKIILSQVETVLKVDPWRDIDQRIKTPAEVQGTVRAVKDYGLFVDIEDGVTGLLHISEIQDIINIKDINPDDLITVQVTRIESATRKVFLKL